MSTFGRNATDKEHPWRLTEKRADDAWFLYSLVLFFEQGGLLKATNIATDKGVSQICDIDRVTLGNLFQVSVIHGFITNVMLLVILKVYDKGTVACVTVSACIVYSCLNVGYCSLDGVEKIHRAMCTAPKS